MAFSPLVHGASASAVVLNTTGADLIIVGASASSVGSCSDNMGNTYHALTQKNGGGGGRGGTRLFWCVPTTKGAGCSISTGAALVAAAYSGAAAAPFDVENGFGDTVSGHTTIQPGSVSPASNGSLIVTSLMIDDPAGSSISINSGFTVEGTVDVVPGSTYGVSFADFIQGAKAAINPTWTRSTPNTQSGDAAVIAVFSPLSPPVFGTPPGHSRPFPFTPGSPNRR